MTHGTTTVLVPVSDVAQAKRIYNSLLGTEPFVDQPYYVGYKVGDLDFGLVPNGHKQGMSGTVNFWEVDDIKASLQSLVDAGAETVQDVRDVGGGKLVATLKDADGNMIGLAQTP